MVARARFLPRAHLAHDLPTTTFLPQTFGDLRGQRWLPYGFGMPFQPRFGSPFPREVKPVDSALLGAGRDALVVTTTKAATPAVNMENKFREEGQFMYLPALSVPAPCTAYPQLLLAQSTTEGLVAAALAGPTTRPRRNALGVLHACRAVDAPFAVAIGRASTAGRGHGALSEPPCSLVGRAPTAAASMEEPSTTKTCPSEHWVQATAWAFAGPAVA
jgi:hypothetical protein